MLSRLFAVLLCLLPLSFQVAARTVSPFPETLDISSFRTQTGTAIYFWVTGRSAAESGSLWGSNPYTDDSSLGKAAVHAGILQAGQTGVVKVTLQPGQSAYPGSSAHDIVSSNYGSYGWSYSVGADDGGDNPLIPAPTAMSTFRTAPTGSVYLFSVTGSEVASVWGTNVFTDDSRVSAAAVHAGVLAVGQTGSVRVVTGAGLEAYAGSKRNGVQSNSYGTWPASFSVSDAAGAIPLHAYPGMQGNPLPNTGLIGAYRGRNGAALYFDVTGATSGGVWGTGFYTDDSSLARAAVHAGVVAENRSGVVKVTIAAGQLIYVGSTANGVTSGSYGSYGGSYAVGIADGLLGTIPAISSVLAADAREGSTFSYAILASESPSSFNATGLPAGLSVSGTTGLITGVPTLAGTFRVQLLASNGNGTSNAELLLRVAAQEAGPVIPTNLSSLSISTATGLGTVQSGGRIALSATAAYANNSSKIVVPVWRSSDPAAASISASGVLTAGSVAVDTRVTITASYTESGQTLSASKTISITAAAAGLSSLAIVGGNVVSSGGLLRLGASATYADGSSRGVAASAWSISPAGLGTINSRGEFSAGTATTATSVSITASYTEAGTTKTASSTITIKAVPATLNSLAIVGARGTLAAGETLSLAAESGYEDGSSKRVAAAWSVSSAAASIGADGKLTAASVTQDTPVLVSASYAEGGKSVTAKYQIIVLASATPTKLTAEVIATLNTQNLSKLQLWFNTDAEATVRSQRAGTTYKLYVAALLPGGALVATPTWFLFNRSKEWQPLAWPLAEYLSGLQAGEWQMIELLDAIDASIISGTQIYVGYGSSDTEMIEAGRYRLVYQVP